MSSNLTSNQIEDLIKVLKDRFEKNMNRHDGICWDLVENKIKDNKDKITTLFKMEESGGEPDVIFYDINRNEYIFCDCSKESPKERRSLCYDRQALDARKNNKPKNSAIDLAKEIGIEILTESEYKELQKLEAFDEKTSSWVKTPSNIREKGGAIFCDYRFGTVFTYHNGADSYYGSRGFRGLLRV